MRTKQDLMKAASDMQLDLARTVDGKVGTAIDLLKGAEATLELVTTSQKLQLQKLRKADKDLSEVQATVQETNQGVHQIVDKMSQMDKKLNEINRASTAKDLSTPTLRTTRSTAQPLSGARSLAAVYKLTQGRFDLAGKVFLLKGVVEKKRKKLKKDVKKELALMCKVNVCKNVIRVFGVVTNVPDELTLVMGYACYGSVRDYLDEHDEEPLPKALVLNIVNDVANGMREIYKHGVEHRDLKAANVFLDEYHGYVIAKVGDFGISKCEELMTHVRNTTTKATAGTLPWKAPEEFTFPFPFDEKCDVFSFAVFMWEVITRANPWGRLRNNDQIELAVKQGHRPEMDDAEYTAVYGAQLLDTLKVCWAQDPATRPTFADVVQRLPISETKVSLDQPSLSTKGEEDIRQQELLAEKRKVRELEEQLQQLQQLQQMEALRQQAEEGAQGEEEAVKVLEEACKKEDIDVILAVMAQHRDSTKVQQQGCYALWDVAHYNDATRPTIAEKGGIEAVFHAMTQHSHDEEVQYYGCYMMFWMVQLESARPAVRKGKAVMDAARNNFPRNGYIQDYLNKVYAKIKKTAEEGAQGEDEAVKVLEEAYGKRDEKGCEVLLNVARMPAFRPTIAEKGGIEAVFHAMTQHRYHERVQKQGCDVMWYMVELESARPAVRKGKAVMDRARNNFPNNYGIQDCLPYVYAKI
eukprot:Stramenopile-MAST_4_protein_4538